MGYKTPLRHSVTASIPTGSVATTVRIPVPAGSSYHVKQVNITKGANTTLSAQRIDGAPTGMVASFDAPGIFGMLPEARSAIEITGTNAGTAAENLTLEVIGTQELN